jgi:uncharacterized repeat protein (TIGR02543 family)
MKSLKRNPLLVIALTVALLLSGLPGSPFSAVSDSYAVGQDYEVNLTCKINYTEAFKVLEIVNAKRVEDGASPLKMSAELLDVAKQRAAEITIYFEHTRPDGREWDTVSESISGIGDHGENIAYGYASAEAVMSDWMNSPSHKENILYPDFTEIGIGCAVSPDGRFYWVQYFGDRASPAEVSQPADVQETFNVRANTDYVTMISFDSCGGSPVPDKFVAHDPVGSSITYGSLPEPNREHYKFDGWYTAAEGGTKITPNTALTGNTVCYAHWKDGTHTIKFNSRGGSEVASIKVDDDATIGELPVPIREGYTFDGWYTSASGGSKIYPSTVITKNDTYYAHWIANFYNVALNANGGKVSPASKIVTFDGLYGTLPTATRTGYTFGGWYTAAKGGSLIIEKSEVRTASDHTLYAHWTAKKFTVKLNVNKGKKLAKAKAKKTVTYGSKYGKLVKATRKGYKFAGWYTKKSGGKKITAASKVTIKKNTTLYAHWKKK